MDNTAPVIGKKEGEALAKHVVLRIESYLFHEFDPEIKEHLLGQFIGMFKNFYVTDRSQKLSHTGIEKSIVGQKFQQAENGKPR